MEQLKILKIQASVSEDERIVNLIKDDKVMGDNFFSLKIKILPSL